MEIKLTEEYRLKTQDVHNVVLEKFSTSKTGNVYWRGVSFYGSLEHALNDCLDSARLLMPLKTKKELNDWFNKIKKIKNENLDS